MALFSAGDRCRGLVETALTEYLRNVLKMLMYFMEESFLVAILAVTSKVKRGVMKTLKETRFNNVKTVFVLRG